MMQADQQTSAITLIILAGGEGSRMHRIQKGLMIWQNKPFIEHLIDRFRNQVATIIISCHRNPQDYVQFGAQIVCDDHEDYFGPLAGIQASLAACKTPLALILACDSPLVPTTLLTRLHQVLIDQGADIALASDGKRLHQLPVLVKTELGKTLQQQITSGKRSLNDWYKSYRMGIADFSDEDGCFLNINSPNDLDGLALISTNT